MSAGVAAMARSAAVGAATSIGISVRKGLLLEPGFLEGHDGIARELTRASA